MDLSANSTIVILDDNFAFSELVSVTLKEIGFNHVIEARNSKEFMNIVRGNEVDLAFIDVNLPDANGLALLSWVKHKKPSIRVVMFSGDTSQCVVIEAKELGADSFLSKFELDKNIRRLLNSWKVNYPLEQF